MALTKIEYGSGDTLTAEQVNEIQDAIIELENRDFDDIGAAPIGLCKTIYTANSDAEDITRLNSILETMGDGEYGGQAVVYAICKRTYSIDQTPMHSWLYRIENINNLYARVEATTSLGDGCKMQRIRFNGEWLPWEHINPPMLVNQEYRTPERWLDKPVYTKLITLTWVKGTVHTISNFDGKAPFKYVGRVGTWLLPFMYQGKLDGDYSAIVSIHKNNNDLKIGMYGGSSISGTLELQLWYTKE